MEEIQSVCSYIENFEHFIAKKSEIQKDDAVIYSLINQNKIYVNTCTPLSKRKHRKTYNVNKVEITVKEIEFCNLVCFDCLLFNGEFYYFSIFPVGFILKLINTISKRGKKEIKRISLNFTVVQTQYNVFSGENKHLHIKSDYSMYAEALKPKIKKMGFLVKSRSYEILDFINRYKLIISIFPKT